MNFGVVLCFVSICKAFYFSTIKVEYAKLLARCIFIVLTLNSISKILFELFVTVSIIADYVHQELVHVAHCMHFRNDTVSKV